MSRGPRRLWSGSWLIVATLIGRLGPKISGVHRQSSFFDITSRPLAGHHDSDGVNNEGAG
jgi:hypothetical protein